MKHNAETPDFGEAFTSMSWALYPTGPLPGPYDPDSDDNLRVFSLTFCGPTATSEGCAGVR